MITMCKGWGRQALAGMLGGLVLMNSALSATPPPGTVSLWEANQLNRGTLKFWPETGWPAQYSLKVPDAAIPTGKVRFVAFSNIPSASRIVLSSDELCQQNDDTDFWIELSAAKESANYPEPDANSTLAVSALMAMQPDRLYGGLRLVKKHQKSGANLDGLACVRMVTSRLPGQVVPNEKVNVSPGPWAETKGTETGLCDNISPVIIGRRSQPLKRTYAHHCAGNAPRLNAGPNAPERPAIRYKGGQDICPTHTALWAFTGTTEKDPIFRLACRSVLDELDRPLQVVTDFNWHGPMAEKDSEFTCGDGKVLVGRKSVNEKAESAITATTWYLCGTVFGYASDTVDTSTARANSSTGTLKFWSPPNPQNGQAIEYALALDAFGTTRQYELRNHGVAQVAGKLANDNVEQLAIEGIPSSTQITLTDDALCDSSKGSFAITLKAWKEGASLSQTYISDLGAGDVGYPVGDGLRLEARRGQPTRNSLSCIKVELSRTPGQSVPNTPVPVNLLADWQTRKEDDHDFKCDTGVLSGAARKGDENGEARYQCANKPGLGVIGPENIAGITESGDKAKNDHGEEEGDRVGIWVMCPFDKVMIGRGHTGDENAKSNYTCASVQEDGHQLAVRPDPQWVDPVSDSDDNDHQLSCGNGKALIGRWHEGDEHGLTRYRCGTLLR